MAKLGTVFRHATAATATAEAATNIWISFSLSGEWQLLLRVLFNVTSGEEKISPNSLKWFNYLRRNLFIPLFHKFPQVLNNYFETDRRWRLYPYWVEDRGDKTKDLTLSVR